MGVIIRIDAFLQDLEGRLTRSLPVCFSLTAVERHPTSVTAAPERIGGPLFVPDLPPFAAYLRTFCEVAWEMAMHTLQLNGTTLPLWAGGDQFQGVSAISIPTGRRSDNGGGRERPVSGAHPLHSEGQKQTGPWITTGMRLFGRAFVPVLSVLKPDAKGGPAPQGVEPPCLFAR